MNDDVLLTRGARRRSAVAGRIGLAHLFLLAFAGISCSDRELPTVGTLESPEQAPYERASATSTVQYVAATWHSANSGSALLLAAPAGVAAGDVMIAHIVVPGGIQVETLSGWQLIRADVSASEASAFAFWKRAGSSEPATYTWALSASSPTAGGIVAYRNVLGTGNPVESHAAQRTTSGTGIVAPSVTVSDAGAMLVTLFSALAQRKEKSLTFTPPSGMQERYDAATSTPAASARNVAAMHASTTLATSGSTGTRTATLSAPRPAVAQTIVLRPGTAAPPPPPDNTPPVADAGGPYEAVEGATIPFNGSASVDPDGDEITYSWTFGKDGVTGATAVSPTRAYPDNGTYHVVLTVTDAFGATAVDSTTATITNAAPTVTLSLSTASAAPGQTVTASASFADAGAADTPWSWELDWGDGTKQTGTASALSQQIGGARAYAAAGEYVVRVSVTDKDGGRGSAQTTVSITAANEPNVWYTDFSEYATNAAPSGWSQPYTTGTWRVVGRADATGGKALYGQTSGSSHYVLRWDAVGTPADVELETVVRVTAASTYNESMALMARGQSGVRTYYASRLDSGSGLWTLARYNDGASAEIATWPNPFPVGTWVRHRFRVEGSSLKVKLWAASAPEPASWTMEATVSSPLGAGYAGVWMRRGNSVNEFDWVKVTVLGSTQPPPPADPEVVWVWSGAQSASGATVRTRLAASSNAVRLRISTDSLFGTYSETATTTTVPGNDVATFQVNGLMPNTRYFYRVVSGAMVNTGRQGAFHTLVAPNTPFSFTFALGSCQTTGTNSSVFTHVRATNPLFWLQTGDIHYLDLTPNDISLYRAAYNNLHDQSNQAALYRSTAIVHVWDDHDGAGGNDTDGTKTGWPAARAAYRESLPHHPLAAGPGGAIYHSFVVGRVRLIISDLRSERSPKGAVDNADKTMFGATQKQYFKNQLALAKTNGEFIVWVSTLPWIGAKAAGADYWAGYDTERREIASYIESLGVGNRMFVLTGDMHATAIDTGLNNVWGGFPVFNAGPLDRAENTKGGPYTHGPTWTNAQFGTVTITDNGGPTITVRFSGRNNGVELAGMSHQFTLSLGGAAN